MSEKIIQDSTLTAIADAIRDKTGKSETMTPAEMAVEISDIESDPEDFINLLQADADYKQSTTVQEIMGYTKTVRIPDGVRWLRMYGLAYLSVKEVDLNEVVSIPQGCFMYARLKELPDLSKVYVISYHPFQNAIIANPGDGAVSIGTEAEYGVPTQRRESTLDGSYISIGQWVLPSSYVTRLTIGNSGIGARFGKQSFHNCTKLVSVDAYIHSFMGYSYTFGGCTALQRVTFRHPADGHYMDAASETGIGDSWFSGNTACTLYDFRGLKHVPTLSNVNAFASHNQAMQIVVPDDLYSEWIAATNWSNADIVEHIVAASDYVE